MQSVPLLTFFVFLGCCSNLVFLEILMKEDPGGGNLVTFLQFLFIAIDGFIFTSKFGSVKPQLPLRKYVILVTLFFVSSVLNNYAFSLNIPMPLHMIFRAGSLIANMIMGIMILNKKYTLSKYLSVATITSGIIICTWVSGKDVAVSGPVSETDPGWSDFFWWSCGIVVLTIALLVSARMGIYQEELYKSKGNSAREALFYMHVLPLPFFLFLTPNLWQHAVIAINSPKILVPVININLPRMCISLIGNVLTQFMCISAVFGLTTHCSSLTVTLILTLRKFLSLLFSIVYFNNAFTIPHWIGTILVFTGTLIFTETFAKIRQALTTVDKKDN